MAEMPTEEAFTAEALAFLQANAEPRPAERVRYGETSDDVSLFAERTPEEEAEEVRAAKQWAAKVFDAGFGWLTGPAEYGGRALPASYQRLYSSVESGYRIPSQACRGIGLGMVAPTLLAHGTEAAKQRWLKGLWRGDLIACQLFSEPSAGSDLASLQTRAVRDGDEWRVSGQKLWTSGAQYSDVGEIICRTDPDVEKHRGLTGFMVDMHAPGVEVRPLRQMTGGASFNEVFFEDVRVPADHQLGDVNGGWTVALTTLMNERAAIGGGGGGLRSGSIVERLVATARQLGRSADPLVRQQLAEAYTHIEVARFTNERALAKLKTGQLPGPELSIAKLALTENLRRVAATASSVLGTRLVADTGEWGTYSWSTFVLGVPGMRVAGGTDEVMRNIIGERVLGLPKDR
jgi:alkylation response protein AidB-like acyl-CoA dehydrogenase